MNKSIFGLYIICIFLSDIVNKNIYVTLKHFQYNSLQTNQYAHKYIYDLLNLKVILSYYINSFSRFPLKHARKYVEQSED